MKRAAIPAVLLVAGAIMNRAAVASSNLSPWDLGGFGMFSSIDAPQVRVLRLSAQRASGESILLSLPSQASDIEGRLRVWPTSDRAAVLAEMLLAEPWIVEEGHGMVSDDGESLESVTVEVFTLAVLEDDQTNGAVAIELILLSGATSP